jgi:Fic family protein
MTVTYVWQRPLWPHLRWDTARLTEALGRARLAQGRLLGKVAALGFELHLAERARVLTDEVVRTASIEGELLDPGAVRSSVARRLGLPVTAGPAAPRHAEGLLDVLLDATTRFDEPLTATRLCAWQAALFPTGRSGLAEIATGRFRPVDKPMRIVSGPIGREHVHFEAPPGERVGAEVEAFLAWFVSSRGHIDGLLRAGIAHFWLVTIHPFEDGNGRVARAVGELALAQDDGRAERYYSLSAQIRADRDAYYRALEQASQGDGDLTDWLAWFLATLEAAVRASEQQIDLALAQARFWQRHANAALNERQRKTLRRVLEGAPGEFEGGLTTRKVAHLTRSSPATAQRDLADLVDLGILARNEAGGRSTSYRLVGYDDLERG